MVTLFVLNVEEFQPLIQDARRRPDMEILDGPPGYTRIRRPAPLEFKRKQVGLTPAHLVRSAHWRRGRPRGRVLARHAAHRGDA